MTQRLEAVEAAQLAQLLQRNPANVWVNPLSPS
jgi:hypothetical protein